MTRNEDTIISRPRRIGTALRAAAALLVIASLSMVGANGAVALPPDGPAPDSPGTSSRVWPTEVAPGDLLYFEVSGYPANETVYIKIDDGTMCSDTSHGACVYHTQALDANGYASGSMVVPEISEGPHWLRMLATGDTFDERTGEKIGYEGYTRRGGNDFTVVASTGNSGGGSAQGSNGGSSGNSLTEDGSNLEFNYTVDPSATAGSNAMDDLTESKAPETDAEASGDGGPNIPVVGIAVLGGAVVVAGGMLTWAIVRRNKANKAAGGGA